MTQYFRGDPYSHFIPVRAGAHLQFVRTCKKSKRIHIGLKHIRKLDFSDIGINRGNTSPAKRRSSQQKQVFNLQRHGPKQRIFFQTDKPVHIVCNPLFYKFCSKDMLQILQNFLKSRIFFKHLTSFNPTKKVRHGIGGKIISQIHRHHQSDRLFHLTSRHLLVNRTKQCGREKYRD